MWPGGDVIGVPSWTESVGCVCALSQNAEPKKDTVQKMAPGQRRRQRGDVGGGRWGRMTLQQRSKEQKDCSPNDGSRQRRRRAVKERRPAKKSGDVTMVAASWVGGSPQIAVTSLSSEKMSNVQGLEGDVWRAKMQLYLDLIRSNEASRRLASQGQGNSKK